MNKTEGNAAETLLTMSDVGSVKVGIEGKCTILIPNGYGDAHYATAYADASDAVENEWNSYAEDEEGFLGVISAKNSRGGATGR